MPDAVSAGLLTVSRMRLAPAVAATAGPAAGLRVLSPQQAEILTAIVERMVYTGVADMPAVRDTRTIETIDQAMQQLDPSLQVQVSWLITLFQWGPPVLLLKPHRFTALAPQHPPRRLPGAEEPLGARLLLAGRDLEGDSLRWAVAAATQESPESRVLSPECTDDY